MVLHGAALLMLTLQGGCVSLTGAGSVATPDLLNAAAVPYVPAAGHKDYEYFLQQDTPRAFVVGENGAWSFAAGGVSTSATEARALELCQGWGGRACKVYARDLEVVWSGNPSRPPPVTEQVLDDGPGWGLVRDRRFLWRGPGKARGLYVWAHGRAANGQDGRGAQPQPHVRAFNNAGYDVVRFDRAPDTDDTNAAAIWLRQGLEKLRAQGYGRVVVGGQSRGAWNALQMLDQPGLVDAVVAIAPAAHGPQGSRAWAWALDDLNRIVDAARSPQSKVVVANFAGDEYDPDPEGRARIFRRLASHVGGLAFLDRPPGLQGHGSAATEAFTRRYAACLLDFAESRTTTCN